MTQTLSLWTSTDCPTLPSHFHSTHATRLLTSVAARRGRCRSSDLARIPTSSCQRVATSVSPCQARSMPSHSQRRDDDVSSRRNIYLHRWLTHGCALSIGPSICWASELVRLHLGQRERQDRQRTHSHLHTTTMCLPPSGALPGPTLPSRLPFSCRLLPERTLRVRPQCKVSRYTWRCTAQGF